jgi:hypothetical protein
MLMSRIFSLTCVDTAFDGAGAHSRVIVGRKGGLVDGRDQTQRTYARVLRLFAETGRVDLACAAAGVARSVHYSGCGFPDYKQAFDDARGAPRTCSREAVRRAHEGVWSRCSTTESTWPTSCTARTGSQVDPETGKLKSQPAFIRKYSDALLILLLKGRRPEVFGNKLEATGKNAKPRPASPVRAWMESNRTTRNRLAIPTGVRCGVL